MSRNSRSFVGLILVAALGAALFASLPASASPIGCTAAGVNDDCQFVSPGGTVKAVGAATAYGVVIKHPNGYTDFCIGAGSTDVEQKSCPAPQGSTVSVWARFGVASATLLWT